MAGIVVIGGGIAGSAAALALHKAGFEVAVYEAHPGTGADIGAFLTLASNGMRALAQFDAAEAVAGIGFPIVTMSLVDATGAELATMPLGEHDHPLRRYRCLRRAELAAALQQEVQRRGIPIRHAARLAAVTEDAAGTTATFADGTSATGDLLVGADGLHSTVRSHLDPATPAYAGQSVFYGYTTEAEPHGEREGITMIRGSGAAFGYLVSPAGETFWFARVPGPAVAAEQVAGATPAQWREHLLPLLRTDTTPAADIVAATGHDLMVTNALHLSPGIRWRSRGAVLIGDAAHAASPATGQGASMALEDAVILAKALRDADTFAAALDRYERHRRPRVERNIAVSAQLTSGGPGPTSSAVGNAALSRREPPRPDDELNHLLDWHTPLPALALRESGARDR
ncbi:MAG TPA: FAD-dependent oxidoreductase [Amycolatopsis sp.]|uniref:FAD-dependent oxidoreductase n=1 Tax=Amycolatopsis sp. TaxID=37632 RepID=UPI002B4692CE|nr:FAD-dependent oxidoreductase [Amycolatopsis sp.]HKS45023.1 FAD-dependent oxidoreductase [Amycolatopsis sp.]